MSIWVTRTQPGADQTARKLARVGYDPFVAPLMQIKDIEGLNLRIPEDTHLLFTSANGVRAAIRYDLPINRAAYCVGDATAAAAKAAGFSNVVSAGGDGAALLRLLRETVPTNTPLLHLGGRHLAVDMARELSASGYRAEHVALYETVPAHLSDTDLNYLAQGSVSAVLLHSPRAAQLLVACMGSAHCAHMTKICLSRAVAQPLRGWQNVFIADHPDEDHLLGTLHAAIA